MRNNSEFKIQNLGLNNSTIILSADKSWEELVRTELGDVETGHNDNGAPTIRSRSKVQSRGVSFPPYSQFQVQGSKRPEKFQISVSHTNGITAVLLSDAPCGIDVERTDRDFSQVSRRYLSPEEQSLSVLPLYPCAAWCAREALYKRLKGKRGDGLLAQMKIVEANLEHNKIVIVFDDKLYEIGILLHEEYLIAYTTG